MTEIPIFVQTQNKKLRFAGFSSVKFAQKLPPTLIKLEETNQEADSKEQQEDFCRWSIGRLSNWVLSQSNVRVDGRAAQKAGRDISLAGQNNALSIAWQK